MSMEKIDTPKSKTWERWKGGKKGNRKNNPHPLAQYIEKYVGSAAAFARALNINKSTLRGIYQVGRKPRPAMLKKILENTHGKLKEKDFEIAKK